MKQKILILILVLSSVAMQAQQQGVIANGGDYFQNSNGSLRWTVGEIVTESYANSSGGLNNGFQQTNIIITEIQDPAIDGREIVTFPNPTQDKVTIKFEKEMNFEFILFDINGKTVFLGTEKKITHDIPFNQLKPGIYILKIFKNNHFTKNFKIEKI